MATKWLFNRPFKTFLQQGGGLTGQQRIHYLTNCNELSCPRNAGTHTKIFDENLSMLFQIVLKHVQDAFMKETDGSKKVKLQHLVNMTYSIKNNKTNLAEFSELQNFNLKSLQYVLLLEYLFYIQNPDYKSEYVNDDITEAVKNLLTLTTDRSDPNPIWVSDIPSFVNFFVKDKNVYQVFNKDVQKARKTFPLQKVFQELLRAPPGGCCPLFPSARVLVPLGEMTVLELLESFLKNIYYIGIVLGLEYADGTLHTPFEFMNHDLIHVNNFESLGALSDKRFINPFFSELKKQQSVLPKQTFDEILLVLFILIHESRNFYNLSSKEINPDTLWPHLNPGFLTDIEEWKNPHAFGGLLPPGMIEKEPAELNEYLVSVFKQFANIWNEFQRTGSFAFLLSSSQGNVVPGIGQNSILEMGFQDGGRRRNRNHRQSRKNRRRSTSKSRSKTYSKTRRS